MTEKQLQTWTCVYCGETHPINHAGMFTKEGMACCCCEPARRLSPRPRQLEPEEEEEYGIREEVDARFYGYSSVEEKRAHEQEMLEDLRRLEREEERERELENLRDRSSDPTRYDWWESEDGWESED